MLGLPDATIAAVAALLVTLSFPFYIYGAWIMIDADEVTWGVLTYHLTFIFTGLALNTGPVVFWMLPRLTDQLNGFAAFHAFLGLQAYAMLVFAFTGIVRIFQAKWKHNLYHDYDEDVLLSEIGSEKMGFWRRRLRIGVFGYVLFWIFAWIVGMARFLTKYQFF